MLNSGNTLRLDNSSSWQEIFVRGAAYLRNSAMGLCRRPRHATGILGLGAELAPLRFGDAALAHEMARGKFSFGGETVTGIPKRIFHLMPVNSVWSSSLQSLEWLRHFVASDQELHRIVARSLVMKWGEQGKSRWPAVTHIRALMALSLSARFLVGDHSSGFEAPFYALIEQQIKRVSSRRPALPAHQFLQALALQYASIAFRTTGALRENAHARFCAVIDQVILPDGGHASRNPSELLDCLLDMIPVRDALFANHEAVPEAMIAAIERMMPMLRMLSHGDHGLGGFQGCVATHPNRIKSLLEHDRVHGRPLLLAPHSGYCRLNHGTGVLIMDVGLSQHCNSALALEFSDGLHRIFTNCGTPKSASRAWQKAAADIAAHNTLEVAGFSHRATSAPVADVVNSPQGSLINSYYSISGKSARIAHERNVFLSQDGRDLRGEDRIVSAGGQKSNLKSREYLLRFHLHPTVKVLPTSKDGHVLLALPNRTSWLFSSRGGNATIEESVFLGGEFGPRRTQQIVIRASTEYSDRVAWALRRNSADAAPRRPS